MAGTAYSKLNKFKKVMKFIYLNPKANIKTVVIILIRASLKKFEYTPFLKPQANASSQ